MSEEALRVLLVDDEASLRKPLARYLGNMYGYHVDTAANEEEAWERVLRAEWPYDVALIDDLLTPKPSEEPQPIGIELMAWIQERCPDTECIIFTGWGMDRALEALQAGAYRYLTKPLNLDELGMAIRMAAEHARLRRERDLLSATLEISKTMLSELNVGETLEVIAEAVLKLVGAEACAVAFLDHATGKVRYDPIIPLGDATVKWHRHLREVQLTKQITEMGEPFVLSDVAAEAKRVDENLRLAGVKSFAGVPILGEPQNLGVLYAYSTQREAFGTHERRVLQLLAGQAAIALKNARLFADTQKSVQRSEALYRTGHALSSYLEEEPVIRSILEAVYHTLGCEHVLISTVDDEAETIGIRHGIWHGKFDVFPEWIEMSQYSLDHPDILTDIYRTGRTEIIKGWDDRFNREIYDKFGHERFLRIFMPIKTRNEVIGVVEVGYDKREKGHMSEDEVQLLAAFMDQAAVALENARLFFQLSETKEQLDVLIESSFDAVIAIDQDKRITIFNRRAEEMFGWKAEEMLGQTVARLHRDVETAKRIFDVVNQGESVAGWNVDLKHRDGIRIPALLSATLIRDSQGRPIGQGGFMRVKLTEDRLSALIRVSQAITSVLELDEVLDLIVKSAVAVFPAAQSGAIHLYDKRADILRVRANTRDYSAEAIEALSLRAGEGIAGWVFQNQQPLVVYDIRQDPRYKRIDHPEVPDYKSIVCVPLRVRRQMIGALSVSNSDVTGAFQPEDVGLLASFADQAAIAIDNARRMRELGRLEEVGRTLATAIEMRDVLQKIVEGAVAVIDAAGAVIYPYNACTDEFELDDVAVEGLGERKLLLTKSRPRKDGTAAAVMTAGFLVVDDVDAPEHEQVIGTTTRRTLDRIGIKSFVGVALKAGTELVGVLYINFKERHTPTEDEQQAIEIYAGQAAVAIQRARLFRALEQALERRADEQTLTHTVAQLIGTVPDPKCTWREILRGALAITGAKRGMVFLVGEDGKKLTLKVCKGVSKSKVPAITLEDERPGIVGWSVLNKKTAFVPDVKEESWSRWYVPTGFRIRSELAVPILRADSDKVIGVINLESPKLAHFTSDDQQLVEQLAVYADLAIHNAQLYRQTQTQLRQIDALFRAGRDIASVRPMQRILQSIVNTLHKTFAFDPVIIYLYDAETNELHSPIVAGAIETWVGKGSAWPGTVLLESILQQEPVHFAEDSASDPILTGPFVHREGIKSSGYVHLKVGRKVIGLLFVNSRTPHHFTEAEKRAVQMFANQAAVAIHNARQYEETERRLRRQAAMLKATRAIATPLDLAQVLRTIADCARKALDFDAVTLYLYDEAQGTFSSPVMSGVFDQASVLQGPVSPDSAVGRMMRYSRPRFADDVTADPIFAGKFIQREKIKSVAGLPLKVEQKPVGVMFFNSRQPRHFTREDGEALEIFANQAAIAIERASLFAQTERRATQLRTAAEVARDATSILDVDRLLVTTANLICDCFDFYHIGVFLVDDDREYAVFRVGSGETGRQMLEQGHRLKIGEEGIVGHVAGSGESHIALDIADDAFHFVNPFLSDTRSEMALPLRVHGETIGVLDVQSTEEAAFTREDVAVLQTLADQLANAIENARQYEELKQTKGLVGARTALAWMGMASSAWRHAIDKHALTIREQARLLRGDLQEFLSCKGYARVDRRLDMIKNLATQILEKPIVPPLSAEERVAQVVVNDLVGERARQLWQNEPYRGVELQLELCLDEAATVRVSPEWLRRAFDVLVDNAADAVTDCDVQKIAIGTRDAAGGVEIIVADTGPGIPGEVLPKLGLEPIEKPEGAKGLGMGLLMAQTIVQTYGGEIQVDSTGPLGTKMVIWLPREK